MVMSKASEDYFKNNASKWDNLRLNYFTDDVRNSAISHAYLRPEMVVADVGAGTGFMTAGLANLVSCVHVFDGSGPMLDVAKKNLSLHGNIEFHLSQGHILPIKDAIFDVVFANMYLHHCPDPEDAIKEMVRTIKPGGRLVITDMDSHRYTWMKEQMADEWMGFDRGTIQTWLTHSDLVNVMAESTGESCCAEPSSCSQEEAKKNAVKISVFVATGTKRIRMRDTVMESYGKLAKTGLSCGCSSGSNTTECCCGEPSDKTTGNYEKYYDPAYEQSIPKDAVDFSLGCGNPLAMSKIKKGDIVLDIGSGGGLDSFLASNIVGSSGKIIGVDMTQAMIDRARASAQKNGITNVEFKLGKAEALPVETATVDVIISNCVINLCEDKGVIFQEAFRVLRDGGHLEISDIVTDTALPSSARKEGKDWAACVTGSLPENEYLALISQAGFKEISFERSKPLDNIHGVKTYSLRVSAIKKGKAANGGCCCHSFDSIS